MQGKVDRILAKIAKGQTAFGTHTSWGGPMITEMYGQAGYDMVWIDTEHGYMSPERVLGALIGANTSDMCAFVRIPSNDPVLAKPLLDHGADGIIFPMVMNADDARKAVEACRYPPDGTRGFGPFRATHYGSVDIMDYIKTQSKKVWALLQIEHIDAVNNLDAILKVPGIDCLIVGPCDLSGSLGHLGDINHPDVKKAMDTVVAKAKAAKVPVGVSMVYNEEALNDWMKRRPDLLFCDNEGGYIINGCKKTLARLKDAAAKR